MRLTSQGRTLSLESPLIMGIVNATPDSFSDGGAFFERSRFVMDKALDFAHQLIESGADILDLGAESTRPGANPVPWDVQLERLLHLASAIKKAHPTMWLSIDTSAPQVMEGLLGLADVWNDVRALSAPNAAILAARLGLPCVLMHHRGTPKTMDSLTVYQEPIHQIQDEWRILVDKVREQGVTDNNIILDIGMGFAKDMHVHTCLMKNLEVFAPANMGYPMLFGVSRKRFLGQLLAPLDRAGKALSSQMNARDTIGHILELIAMQKGANIIRTHDVQGAAIAREVYVSLG